MGRGTHYSWWRRIADFGAHALLGSGWGARAAFGVGLQGRLESIEHQLPLPRPASSGELRIAFASDLHAGPLTDPRIFAALAQRVEAFQPHLVLLGGDYVSVDADHIGEFLRPIAALRPPLGTFAVMGNHDLWLDDAAIAGALASAGVVLLVNEARVIDTAVGALCLYGMDEPYTGAPEPPPAAQQACAVSVVLMHSPHGLRLLKGLPFDLALCGHTHGGQIALPGGIPVVLPRGSGPRHYARGEFQLPWHAARMIVSRGVGMSDLPVRLFAPSEVHLCTLAAPSRQPAA
jgi:predicted MPP superfamily phosphohydrolase